jgi:putative ABC transport system ATP-binding protein
MVTHDARAAAVAHRVLFLADGEIIRELGECDAHRIHEVMEELAAAA